MIYNTSGQLVKTIYNREPLPSGIHEIQWNGDNDQQNIVPQGIYFIVLKADKKSVSKTCIRL
jgi:flagellar hook assembly protein FlgD